jgi:hypothetical protein
MKQGVLHFERGGQMISRRGAPVLVVCSRPKFCQRLEEVLVSHGFNAESTTEMWLAFKRLLRQPYSALICEAETAALPGTVLASRVRRILPDLPILLLCSTPDEWLSDEVRDLDITLVPSACEGDLPERAIGALERRYERMAWGEGYGFTEAHTGG